MGQLQPYVPEDIRQIVEQVKRELTTREYHSEQTRDYHIDCANGDEIDIHEVTRIWVREVG